MATFKNKNFIKRNYEATNIVFCQAKEAPGEQWIECEESEIAEAKAEQLYMQADVRYFGYL